ncbi:hypothetical protein GCM10010469_31050 [Streptomyces labedae]|uniref:Uncharacterized protein n=1 Tax=Streptomyces labedae TaxID=285569 RepID=A0ABP6QYC4_9ACTN
MRRSSSDTCRDVWPSPAGWATGLSLLRIDRESDEGVYREPNVWMRHR